MMREHAEYFEANKQLWNKRTLVHKASDFYDVKGFLSGNAVLGDIEVRELGPVKEKTLLHLQCHFGLDSLDWARKGAKVTGVDFSEVAIEEARRLNEQVGLDARFICCNVYDLQDHLREKFDIVFTSYGVIGWLPDLNKWASLISDYLKPGGIFYMAEFHPVVWMFDDNFSFIQYSYENREVIHTHSQGTYTDRGAEIKGDEYGWNHSLSEVINALIGHGLQIESLNEYMYSPYQCFNNMKGSDGRWYIQGLEEKIPMVYSLKASSPG